MSEKISRALGQSGRKALPTPANSKADGPARSAAASASPKSVHQAGIDGLDEATLAQDVANLFPEMAKSFLANARAGFEEQKLKGKALGLRPDPFDLGYIVDHIRDWERAASTPAERQLFRSMADPLILEMVQSFVGECEAAPPPATLAEAYQLESSTDIFHALANQGGKAEVDGLADGLNEVAMSPSETGKIARELVNKLNLIVAENREHALEKASLVRTSLSHDQRVEAQAFDPFSLDADKANGLLDVAQQALSEGDGRLANAIVNRLRTALPGTTGARVATLFDDSKSVEEVFETREGSRGFTFSEVEALEERMRQLRMDAHRPATEQAIDFTAIITQRWPASVVTSMNYKMKSLRLVDPPDAALIERAAAVQAKAAEHILSKSASALTEVEDAVRNGATLTKIPHDLSKALSNAHSELRQVVYAGALEQYELDRFQARLRPLLDSAIEDHGNRLERLAAAPPSKGIGEIEGALNEAWDIRSFVRTLPADFGYESEASVHATMKAAFGLIERGLTERSLSSEEAGEQLKKFRYHPPMEHRPDPLGLRSQLNALAERAGVSLE